MIELNPDLDQSLPCLVFIFEERRCFEAYLSYQVLSI